MSHTNFPCNHQKCIKKETDAETKMLYGTGTGHEGPYTMRLWNSYWGNDR